MRFGALAFALSALSAVVLPACAVAAPCEVVYNTDGCDMLYYTRGKPVTAEGFVSERLSAYIPGSAFTRLAYCPQSSGFGHFTALDGWELADTGLYRKTKVRVSTLTGEALAWTYVLDAYEGGLPSASYLGVLADAAEAADAPDDYVLALRKRPCRSVGH